MLNWISVKDRLPDTKTEVILTNGNDIFIGCIYYETDFNKWGYHSYYNNEYITITSVTHWMSTSELLAILK